jgi:heme-degrading monooxygenase HmoA
MNCWFESRSSRQIHMRGKQRPQEEQAEIEQHCPHPCIVLAVMKIE